MIIASIIVLLMVFAIMVIGLQTIMKKNVVVATEHLDELTKDFEEKEKGIQAKIEETNQKCLQMATEANDQAQQAKAATIKEGEEEKAKLIEEGRRTSQELIDQAEKSRKLLLAEIQERIGHEATEKACLLLQETLSEDVKRQLHQHWAQDLIAGNFENLSRLRVPENLNEIKVVSAFALSDTQLETLGKKLKAVLGRAVSMKQETDDKLVAGIVIYLDSLVLDGSLKSKLQKQSKNIQT